MTQDECQAASGQTLTAHVRRNEESGDSEEARGCGDIQTQVPDCLPHMMDART